ncbi:hypothetical protein [Kosakonia sacchari]|uniref:hypothetical protein n=1 Tax=Kosakonia sacchari TaxID=1158459 RepID=UPI0020C82857|nr:hypothetical protein [Kosakonia sacchari]
MMKSLSEIVAFFAVGMVLKMLSEIIAVYPNVAQQLLLWLAYFLLALSAVLLAFNRFCYWRHRHNTNPEVPRDQ